VLMVHGEPAELTTAKFWVIHKQGIEYKKIGSLKKRVTMGNSKPDGYWKAIKQYQKVG